MLEISALTARRYVMGRSGLWPGRRWRGLDGTGTAMRAMEDLQLDPLVVVARAHDLALHSRVDRLRHRRLGDAHLRAARVLRMGRLARRPPDG